MYGRLAPPLRLAEPLAARAAGGAGAYLLAGMPPSLARQSRRGRAHP